MKRSGVSLAAVAELDNLADAFWRAARAARDRSEVERWRARLDRELEALDRARQWLAEHQGLALRPDPRIQRSAQGLGFCGYRILPGNLRL